MLLFRFNAPITFFNAPYFKRELMRVVDEAGPNLRHVVIDLLPVTNIDATGLLTVTELVQTLETRGIRLNAAGRATEWRNWARSRGFAANRILFERAPPRPLLGAKPTSPSSTNAYFMSTRPRWDGVGYARRHGEFRGGASMNRSAKARARGRRL